MFNNMINRRGNLIEVDFSKTKDYYKYKQIGKCVSDYLGCDNDKITRSYKDQVKYDNALLKALYSKDTGALGLLARNIDDKLERRVCDEV